MKSSEARKRLKKSLESGMLYHFYNFLIKKPHQRVKVERKDVVDTSQGVELNEK